jgi:hypothetical protein
MSKNYEKLYNDLKAEFDQAQKDNDEICKEYESTIQMLTESVNNYQKEKDSFQSRISQLEKDIKKYEKEKETLANRNKDKIIDIQNLNKMNEKLKDDMKKISDEKHLIKSKIIALENDNDHYMSKLRQNDALIEDLTNQLESALEENITLQTEFELYKQQNEEALIRKDQEIKDFQNDISNKEKIIKRLNDKRASIRELKQKFLLPKDMIEQYQRKLTNSIPLEELQKNFEKDKEKDKSNQYIKSTSNIGEGKLVTPVSNTSTKYPPKFFEIYRKSIRDDNIIQKKDTIKQHLELKKKASNNINDNKIIVKKNSKNTSDNDEDKEKDNVFSKVSTLKEDTIVDLKDVIEDKNNKEEIEDDDSSVSDKKCFEDLVICDEKDFNIIPIKKLMNQNKKTNNKKLEEYLKSLLLITQKRKEALINHQKANNKKLEKIGFKLRY